jgi:plastocyanin
MWGIQDLAVRIQDPIGGGKEGTPVRLVVGSLLCAVSITACGGSGPASSNAGSKPGGAGTASVAIQNYAYSPSNVNISVGGSVQWTNNDATTHSVTADATGGFSNDLSGTMPGSYGGMTAGGTFTQMFPAAGTFTYHCRYHASMHGTVTVGP